MHGQPHISFTMCLTLVARSAASELRGEDVKGTVSDVLITVQEKRPLLLYPSELLSSAQHLSAIQETTLT